MRANVFYGIVGSAIVGIVLLVLFTGTTTQHSFSPSKLSKNEFSLPVDLKGGVPQTFPKISLMIRTAGVPRLQYQFYCIFLRTLVLFWPHSYGDLVLILDKESPRDHLFGDAVLNLSKTLPNYPWNVIYEAKPQNEKILTVPITHKSAQYNRQMWSTFFSDVYSSHDVVAYMDTDVMLVTPVTPMTIFTGKKLKVYGVDTMHRWWVRLWDDTNRLALGFPIVVNFMITFPQYLFRDTYKNCRNHIMKRLKVKTFEEAWAIFYPKGKMMSPICIIMSYAWYFERDRYDWHLKANMKAVNARLPKDHQVRPSDIVATLISGNHISEIKKWMGPYIVAGYCQANKAAGNRIKNCNVDHDPKKFCDFHESLFIEPRWPLAGGPDCSAKNADETKCCMEYLKKHYAEAGNLVRNGHLALDATQLDKINNFASVNGVKCEQFKLP